MGYTAAHHQRAIDILGFTSVLNIHKHGFKLAISPSSGSDSYYINALTVALVACSPYEIFYWMLVELSLNLRSSNINTMCSSGHWKLGFGW